MNPVGNGKVPLLCMLMVRAAVLLGCARFALADVVTLGTARDNTLYQDPNGLLSNGAGKHMFAGTTATGAFRRALLAFDVASAVPANSTIDRVSLTLHMSQTIAGAELAGLHRLLADWGEGASDAPGEEGGGAAAQPGDATWKHTFFPTDVWATLGGDFAAAPSAVTTIGPDTGFYTWDSTVDLVADVQAWLDDPAASHGWAIRGNEASTATAKRFDTRENPNPTMRPALTIEFTPIPEPATAGLLVALTVAAGARGRRS